MTLSVDGLEGGYGGVQVLRGVSLSVAPGEVHALIGRNGAGKTTTLKAIMGLLKPTAGRIDLDGTALTDLPAHEIPRLGLGYVPQGRRLFAELTVAENIDIGLFARGNGEATRQRLLGLFPLLRDRLRQRAGTLSGGEQQMLAIARALALEPSVLLLDEPTEGLMPSMIASIIKTIAGLKADGVGAVLVEQRVDAVLALADRVTFIDNGATRETVPVASLKADPALLHRYVGVGIARNPLSPSVTGRGPG